MLSARGIQARFDAILASLRRRLSSQNRKLRLTAFVTLEGAADAVSQCMGYEGLNHHNLKVTLKGL
jgi:hypothetical protein